MKRSGLKEYHPSIGERVIYRGGWGADEPVEVTCIGEGEKNDLPVYDTDNGRWGYAHQFERLDPETGKTA